MPLDTKVRRQNIIREIASTELEIMEIQDPSNPGPGSNPSSVNQASHPQGQQRMSTTTSFQNSISDVPLRGSWHRRAHSEVHFRLPDDLDLSDPFDGRSPSFEELGSEDDIFCTYMDMDKLGSMPDDGSSAPKFNNAGESGGGGVVQRENGGSGGGEEKSMRPRHRHSNSMDGSSMLQSVEAKKAMAPDKLAELWTVDPKRAKRILANRQSASRSKERKARYIIELERKVQTLHTEATTLSAQLTLFQRDTSGLTTENTDLKLRLQSIEQQAHLRDALNEALKKEVERLKVATGEVLSHTDNFSLGMSQVPFTHSSFFPNQLQPGSGGPQNMQMPQFHPFQSNMPNSNQQMLTAAHSHACSDMLQQDPLGRFQGLDINSRDYHLVKNEGPSIPASENITRF